MIDARRAEAAVEWMIENGSALAAAKADVVKADDMLKHTRALAMSMSEEKSAAAQEREAYCSKAYLDAVEKRREAVYAAEKMKAEWRAAEMTVDFWRSLNSSQNKAAEYAR